MVADIGGSALQYFLDILLLILLYISKVGIWIGIMFSVEKISKAIITKNTSYHIGKIDKGIVLIVISSILYLILL